MRSPVLTFACSDGPNAKGLACDTILWPALLTDGAPIAGPGVNPKLLGTVTRTDLPGLGAVQQVTYAGMPLYRFNRDEDAGGNGRGQCVRPVVQPHRHLVPGRAASRQSGAGQGATCSSRPLPSRGTGPNETVLAATMDQDFTPFLPRTAGPSPPTPRAWGMVTGKAPARWGAGAAVSGAVCPVLAAGPHLRQASSRNRRRPARPRDDQEARRHPAGDLQGPTPVPVRRRRLHPRLAVQRRNGVDQRSGCGRHCGACSTRSRCRPRFRAEPAGSRSGPRAAADSIGRGSRSGCAAVGLPAGCGRPPDEDVAVLHGQ